jgi:hypothetical protein
MASKLPLSETVSMALLTLRSNRLRSLLTMLGIVIGVSAVIAMDGIGRGAQRAINDRITALGTTLLTVTPGQGAARGVASETDRARLRIRDADALLAQTGVLILAVNAPEGAAAAHSRLVVHHALPLGVGTVRGVRLDAAHGGAGWLDSAWRALEPAGRLVAPTTAPLPTGVVELARDEREWVAEVQSAASGLIPLRRR